MLHISEYTHASSKVIVYNYSNKKNKAYSTTKSIPHNCTSACQRRSSAQHSNGDRMQIEIGNILPAEELATVRATLKQARFVDGRATAGFAARPVKNNRQAAGADRSLETIRKLVAKRILDNEVFPLAVRPKALSPLLFSRYDKAMHYGSHVDDALMNGMRTDVSFTLFLSDPEDYGGGELVIESAAGEEAFKPAAGSLVAYPSTSLHRVARGDAREKARRGRLGAQLHPRRGPARAPVRSRYRASADVRTRGQVRGLRPGVEIGREPDANVGGGLSPAGQINQAP